MKKLLLFTFILAGLLPTTGRAEASLSIEDFNIVAGEEKPMLIDLANPGCEVTMVQFDLHLPVGLTLKEGEEGFDMAGRTSWRYQSLSAVTTDGIVRFTLSSSGNYAISGTSGAIIKIMLKAADTFTNGTISLENILISCSDQTTIRPTDYAINVGVTPKVESTLVFGTTLQPVPESVQTLLIGLTNPDDDITLVQFDLLLPEGVSLKPTNDAYDIEGRTSWRYHSLYARAAEQRVRVLLASPGNTLLSGNEGYIISIKMEVDGNIKENQTISMDNILLVTPDERIIRPKAVVSPMVKRLGDVNGDGSIDVADISAILTTMADEPNMIADTNEDKRIDVADISMVLTKMAEGTSRRQQ